MKRFLTTGFASFWVVSVLAPTLAAQGVLISVTHEPTPLPRPIIGPSQSPPTSYKIKELAVQARVVDQVARVQVSQSFVNTGSRQMEVSFVFPLPYEGAIDRLTFLVDGKEFPAKLLPAKEARKIYEDYVRRAKDPALLEWVGTGMFKTSVFPVPAGAERKVTLRYNQLLRKDHSLTDFLFPMGTAKYTSAPVENVEIAVSIESSIELKSVYSPTHSIEVKRQDKHHAKVSYTSKNTVPTSDFRLFFDVAKGKLGASVLSYRPEPNEDGYFLLLASPQIKQADAERPKKNVVCVFDRSGSMSGKKIEQAREALKHVLNNLRKGDRFNVIAYDSQVESFQPEMQPYNDQLRKKAIGFVEGLYAGGGTNIHDAVSTAMKMLTDSSRPNFIIFMTDGQPTMGETDEAKIVESAQEVNQVRARLICFGVGYDVNSRLLDRLARSNFGQSEYVRPNEDIETQVSRLYNKISSPVLSEVSVNFEFDAVKVEQGPPINRLYPKKTFDLFEGEQLVVVGRYKKDGPVKIKIAGTLDEDQQEFDFPAELVTSSGDDSYSFVEKLWAMRRIGEIIDELDLQGQNDELVKELVALSTKHGILTPYTSFLADESARPGDLAATGRVEGVQKAAGLLKRLDEADGIAGFAQREAKHELMEAQLAAPAAVTAETAGGEFFGAGPMLRDIDRDKDVAVQAVQVIGKKVLYKRGNVWYSFDVAKQDAEKVAAKAKVITRFSEEYFELVGKAAADDKRVLSRQKTGEELMLEVDGDVYHVK